MYNYVMLSGDKTYKHSSVDTVRSVINHLGLRSTLHSVHCLQSRGLRGNGNGGNTEVTAGNRGNEDRFRGKSSIISYPFLD